MYPNATITTTEINDPSIASGTCHAVTIYTPLLQDRAIKCYNIRAVMVLLSKYEVQHVDYPQPQDGLLVAHLNQLGITMRS